MSEGEDVLNRPNRLSVELSIRLLNMPNVSLSSVGGRIVVLAEYQLGSRNATPAVAPPAISTNAASAARRAQAARTNRRRPGGNPSHADGRSAETPSRGLRTTEGSCGASVIGWRFLRDVGAAARPRRCESLLQAAAGTAR